MSSWPDFFIVGAPKAGTTSLFHYLAQQPAIFVPAIKEPHFFCPELAERLQIEHPRSTQDYLDLFAPAGSEQLRGEASVSYLRAPESPELIRRQAPAARIIILLREPGERAFSHYLMRWRAGGFGISFSEGLANYDSDKPEYRLFRELVVEPGFYGAQIPRYLASFPREQVKLIVAEDFFANPETTVEDTLAFLGVTRPVEVTQFAQHNEYVAPRGRLSLLILRQKRHLRFLKPWIPAQLKWRIIRKYFNKPAEKPVMSSGERQQLNQIYAEDLHQVRTLLDRPGLWSGKVPAENRAVEAN